jgi:hypothetical protein
MRYIEQAHNFAQATTRIADHDDDCSDHPTGAAEVVVDGEQLANPLLMHQIELPTWS